MVNVGVSAAQRYSFQDVLESISVSCLNIFVPEESGFPSKQYLSYCVSPDGGYMFISIDLNHSHFNVIRLCVSNMRNFECYKI